VLVAGLVLALPAQAGNRGNRLQPVPILMYHVISSPHPVTLQRTTVDAARLTEEVSGSREAIRKQFHVPVNVFCYPAGRYDAAVIAAVQRAGFLGATTTNPGLAKPGELYTLSRIRVNGSETVSAFASTLHQAGV